MRSNSSGSDSLESIHSPVLLTPPENLVLISSQTMDFVSIDDDDGD